MKNNSSKQVLLSVLGIAILVVAVVGISFAAFTFSQAGTKENTVSTGTISITYTEGTAINIDNAMPTSDDVGKSLSGENEQFKFTVGATISGTATINYEIAAVKKEPLNDEPTIADDEIRLYLTKDVDGTETEVFAPAKFTPITTATNIGSPVGTMILASGTFTSTSSSNYILRMWMSDTSVIDGTAKAYVVTVNVYAKTV